jgi:benzoate/toluate 1,2-dioxygenase alpha subunit
MATPDDLEEFRACQNGYGAAAAPWNDMSRGAQHWIHGPDEHAAALGMNPVLSGKRTEDEGLFAVQHAHWVQRMQTAVAAEAGALEPARGAA